MIYGTNVHVWELEAFFYIYSHCGYFGHYYDIVVTYVNLELLDSTTITTYM